MKVEYRSEKRYPWDNRRIWYRKDLSDTPWWKKIFIINPWKKVYRSFNTCFPGDTTIEDCLMDLFNFHEANEIAEKYKTVEELEKFLNEEKSKAEKMLKEHLNEQVDGWRF